VQQVTSQHDPSAKLTVGLLSCGVVAGPLFYVVAVIQMVIRPGFDPTSCHQHAEPWRSGVDPDNGR
jgi:hypothetical protein